MYIMEEGVRTNMCQNPIRVVALQLLTVGCHVKGIIDAIRAIRFSNAICGKAYAFQNDDIMRISLQFLRWWRRLH